MQEQNLPEHRKQSVKVPVKVKRFVPDAILPSYAHEGDSCFDLFSTMYAELKPGERAAVETGIACQAPAGWGFRILDRSGLARNHGISTRGGVIDSGYTAAWVVLLINESDTIYLIEPGDKIAQVRLERVFPAELIEVDSLEARERGPRGFGSSDRKPLDLEQAA